MAIYTHQSLYEFAKSVFIKMGCSDADALTASDTLLSADLRGVDSHGSGKIEWICEAMGER